MEFPRIRHFDTGTAMVVTDLHGEGDAFDHLIQTFFELRDAGRVDRLIICGDLIHIRRPVPDDSIRMILEIIKWQNELGDHTILMLMGNHEMPHVYNVTLTKGHEEYTASFEQAMTQSGKRDEITHFLRQLPFYVSTQAGVLISHAGASAAVTKSDEAYNILTFDHDALLHLAEDKFHNQYDIDALKQDLAYHRQAMHFLGLTGMDDPRYHHLFRGRILSQLEDEFTFLWDVLFTRNEQKWGLPTYGVIAENFLKVIGDNIGHNLTVIVAGHIATRGGYELIGDNHLRLSTYAHANPHEAGKYLLLDCAKPIVTSKDLVSHLRSLFN